ncbi:MAG TPA: branched-chain amino acid aminotransferase [Clostridiales bacterium]|jgi:branched-chain amino acid aminotransferase|nr:branched-chain amino acid aminotransferase [Clostridiales bacterium]
MKQSFSCFRNECPKEKPPVDGLVFGEQFTDHMFLMDYDQEQGWHDGRIVPYGPLELDPAAGVLHYSQTMFEGLKAYRAQDGRVLLFRPDKNEERARMTALRICIPPLPEGTMVEAVKQLVAIDQEWIPEGKGNSLYIRPFIFATEPFLGVRDSKQYKFVVILSPVGPYFAEGMAPTRIFVEDEYVRAAPGGTGHAKIGSNYVGALKAQEKAHEKGYSQVLWLDSKEHRYVEEIGTSNAFFVINGEVITAPLGGTILPGITRDSVIHLLREWGVPVHEKRLSIDQVYQAHQRGELDEMFATGTAAVISPVGELGWEDKVMRINEGRVGALSKRLYDELCALQLGEVADPYNWVVEVK